MRKIMLLIIFVFNYLLFYGQEKFKQNDIYLEAGGNGLFGSISYERQLTPRPGFGIRAGVGFYSEKQFYLTIPVSLLYLFPIKKNAFVDASIGTTWTQYNGKLFSRDERARENSFVNFIPAVGYRVHTPKDLMWRISLTPVINENGFVPWAGVSVGKRF